MIKGCHKEIVFLKDTGNELFEEAYFVLKPYALAKSEGDIVLEATKIANGIKNSSIKTKERKKVLPGLLLFLLGGAISSIIFLILNSVF